MSCPYETNSFCASLPASVKSKMCDACSLRKINKKRLMNVNCWDGYFVVLVKGLMIAGYDKADKLLVTGFANSGTIVGNSKAFKSLKTDLQQRLIEPINDCVVASFNEDFVYNLCKSHIELGTYILMNSLKHYWVEKEDVTRAINGRDAKAAVRFVLSYCKQQGIKDLTHEQIATMCNRARPTVSKIIQDLIREEPELFQ